MSYNGYEYSHQQSYGGGGYIDPMGGFAAGNYMEQYGGNNMAGGFMNNTGETESKSTDKKKIGDRQSFIQVTAKQLLESNKNDDLFMIDGHELHTVQLVGTLHNLKLDSTNITFKLNDNTSVPLDCKQWLDKDKPNSVTNIRAGTLVRVIGNIREYDNKKHLLVFHVSPVTDWNALTHQILGVILTHCQNTKGPIPGSTAIKQQPVSNTSSNSYGGHGGGGMNFSSPAPNHNNSYNMNRGISATNNPGFGMNRDNTVDQVYKAYTDVRPHLAEGTFIENALQTLRKQGVNIDMNSFRNYVNQLCDDGRLYSTVDDNHHNPTSEEF